MVDSPSALLEFLNEVKAKPLKCLSQNFLIDKNIIKKIVDAASLQPDDLILEIGPGPGALTEMMAKIAKKIIAVEKDKIFANQLLLKMANVFVYEADFLKFPFEKLLVDEKKKAKVVANLPYHIASPIIAKLLQKSELFSEMTFMIQYEMAKRLISKPNSKDYGAFTLFTNFYSTPKLLFEISPNSFFPRPKVKSAIIQLKIKETPSDIDKNDFHQFVQKNFQHRRKKLSTNLKNILETKNFSKSFIEEIFSEISINPDARPESLSLEEFIRFYKKTNLYTKD